jgi:histidine triad (HIT) family protein
MAKYTGQDIYCDLIIPGRVDVEIVKETESVLAFHHTTPHWPVHVVVVCKQHVPSLLHLEHGLALEVLDVVKEVAATVESEHGACRVLTNLGSYQDSKHLHIHVSSGTPLNNA